MDDSGARRTWFLGAAVVVTLMGLAPLLADSQHYFRGDTAAAYYGWWFHLGEELRAGRVPQLDLQAWRAGNLAAEGQWGLWSPAAMVLGLLTTVAGSVLALATAVAVGLAVAGSLGVLALARSYGAAPPAAFLAAVAAPLGGVTQYLDLPSWKAALTIWALVPWVWWALRRLGGGPVRNPVLALPAALVLAYLLVTVGYVYGTIMLILVLVACLLERLLDRDRPGFLRVFGVGVVSGLVAVTVYLPGVLTVDVTIRSLYEVDDRLTADVGTLVASVLPTAIKVGPDAPLPYAYVGWFLPLLALVDVRALRGRIRASAGLVLTATVLLAVLLGPSAIGPLRWPLRLQPFLVQVAVVGLAVLLSRCRVRQPSPVRLLVALGWPVLAHVVASARTPALWEEHLVVTGVVVVGLTLAWWAARRGRTTALVGVVLGTTVLVAGLQDVTFHETASPRRNMPASLAAYRIPLATAEGDVMVVGGHPQLLEREPSAAEDLLVGSAWYLNPHPVQNTYTTISFEPYYHRYCIRYDGRTCPDALDALLSVEPATGTPRIDLLAVSTLLLVRDDFPAAVLRRPPAGWHVSEESAYAVTWVRDSPVPTAGGPVWTSPGTAVAVEQADDREVRLRVADVPAEGGQVVLSRLAWPGYRVSGGTLAAPVDDYLLTVDVPAASDGDEVVVRWDPPGWRLELASWWLAVVGGLVWCGVAWWTSAHKPGRSGRRSGGGGRRGGGQ